MTSGMVSTFFMPQSSFSSILRLAYFSIFSILFETIFISFGIDTSINFKDFSFLSIITMSGLLLVTRLSVWMSKSRNTLMTSFPMTGKARGCTRQQRCLLEGRKNLLFCGECSMLHYYVALNREFVHIWGIHLLCDVLSLYIHCKACIYHLLLYCRYVSRCISFSLLDLELRKPLIQCVLLIFRLSAKVETFSYLYDHCEDEFGTDHVMAADRRVNLPLLRISLL